jgi:nucleosome binding factor SPN SPT16 subunit
MILHAHKLQISCKSPLLAHFDNNSTISLWLLNYQFSDTVMVLLKDKVIFAVSPKKGKSTQSLFIVIAAEILKAMVAPSSYLGA